ncbi:MAG TPA: autoinducer binding domain-containing protein [Allosphingosinicella sp.]|nr:autoinducer binding domain-containing protein [Allosphingosinicella sp.]
MNPRQHCQEIIAAIGAAETVEARWPIVARLLGHMGIDQINYGTFGTGDRETADVRFLSTMRPDWIAYYGDKRLDLDDPHVTLVRHNNLTPYRWSEEAVRRLDAGRAKDVAQLSAEAGLRSQWQVTLPDMDGSPVPVAGMALGSSLPARDFAGILEGNEAALVTIAHLFHHCSIREVRRAHAGVPRLSPRERDALTFVADGRRIDRIAGLMGLARVTVEMHLRGARRKLKARTLPEAVAKAIHFGELKLGY